MEFEMINIRKGLLIICFGVLLVQAFILLNLKVINNSDFNVFNAWHVCGGD